ncbi:hypothetical protein GCM10007157_36010 [Vreelandella hamiltonii]|uniref:Uncharacterized protein n=1 Tax=Vreelandella hamiltonii TaxID=502829 RepID=A0A8H9LY31_9GAMM|nr:hypothetical protein GCM10007157_36010 [Halomonas hamiltonii]
MRELLNTAYQGISAQCEKTLGNAEVHPSKLHKFHCICLIATEGVESDQPDTV